MFLLQLFIGSDEQIDVNVFRGNIHAGTDNASAPVPLFLSDLGETCNVNVDGLAV